MFVFVVSDNVFVIFNSFDRFLLCFDEFSMFCCVFMFFFVLDLCFLCFLWVCYCFPMVFICFVKDFVCFCIVQGVLLFFCVFSFSFLIFQKENMFFTKKDKINRIPGKQNIIRQSSLFGGFKDLGFKTLYLPK